MKKLLFLLPFLALNLYADTISTGTLFVTLPSTNTIDKNKSWATKLNEGTQAIISRLTTNGNNLTALGTDTTTLRNDFNTYKSTTGSILTALSNDTTTLRNDFNTYKSTTDPAIAGLNTSTGAIASRPFVTTIYDEGVVQGNVTTLNFVGAGIAATVASATGTVTVTATGGGSSVVNTTFPYVLPIDGPLFLSTTTPAAFRFTNRSTFTVVGWQACVEKASSSSATMFELAWSSSTLGQSASGGGVASPGNYGLTYYPFTFKLEITTQARCSVYQSTVVPIWQETEWGVRVTTITDSRSTVFSGLPVEGARISVFGWENRGTTW